VPETTAGSSSHLDVLALEIIRGRLKSVVDEAGATLIRTAFSSIIREAKDFTCAILTAEGKTVAQSTQSIPVFLGTMGRSARTLLQRFPLDSWRPGDVVMTNDPWIGPGHLFDFTALAPVFVDDRIAAFAGVIAHVPDAGGTAWSMLTREVYEEGIRFPPLKVISAGRADSTFFEILRGNVRVSDEVVGDVEAIQNAVAVITRRTASLCRERGVPAFHSACRALEQRTEAFVRAALGALPDGVAQASASGEGVAGHGFTVRARLEIRGDSLLVDYAGTSDQTPTSLNASFTYTQAYTLYALKCALAPELPFNDGLAAAVTIVAPEGSVVHSRFPAAGTFRHLVGHYLPTLMFEALAELLPEPRIAESGVPQPHVQLHGFDPAGAEFVVPVVATSGFGARPRKDGPSCMAFPLNTETVPIEMLEATVAILLVEKELLPDSAGAGRTRGGLGQRITLRARVDDVRVRIGAQLDHRAHGTRGGGPGRATRVLVDGEPIIDLAEAIPLLAGQSVTIESPGGGGYGDPAQRPREAVDADVLNGYVSPAAAAQLYGWAPRSD
jgi:N-methylhydantoinase B